MFSKYKKSYLFILLHFLKNGEGESIESPESEEYKTRLFEFDLKWNLDLFEGNSSSEEEDLENEVDPSDG